MAAPKCCGRWNLHRGSGPSFILMNAPLSTSKRSVSQSSGASVRPSFAARFQRPEGLRLLYLTDAIGLYSLMVLITVARFGSEWPTYPVAHYLSGFAVATFVHLSVNYFGGLYERDHGLGSRLWLPRAAALTAVAILVDATLVVVLDRYLMPRLNLAFLAFTATLLVAFNRWLAHSMYVVRFGRPRVLLVGNPDDTSLAENHLQVSDRDAIVEASAPSVDDVVSLVEKHAITDVMFTSGHIDDIYPDPLALLEQQRISVYFRLESSDTLLGIRRSHQIAGMPFVIVRPHALPPHKRHLKRAVELLILTAVAPVVALLLALLALYVRMVAGSGVLYTQERVGRNGELYMIKKFRTMYHGAESMTGPAIAERDDQRVVPMLHWLRSARFDELPQVWNVLKGEMSLVGPRPERPEFTAAFSQLIPGYSRRHDLPPGITGLAQVQGGYHTDPVYKLGHDLHYLVNWSPVLDLQILFRTVWVVLARKV